MKTIATRLALLTPLTLAAAFVACSDDASNTTTTDTADGGGGDDASTSPPPEPMTDGSAPDPTGDAGVDAGPTFGAHVIGYVYSDQAAPEDPFTPPAASSYNAAGGAIHVERTAPGNYAVKFAGLAATASGVAVASAVGSTGGLCHWSSSEAETVRVRCADGAGNNADAKFTLTVFATGVFPKTSILGYAHADQPAEASYTPAAARSNNAVGGGAITATRSAAGSYAVSFGGLGANDVENVQVMTFGEVATRCVVDSWTGGTVEVRCYDGDTLTDAQYMVLLVGRKPGATARIVAYAHADQNAEETYAPATAYNEGQDGGVLAMRAGAGTYGIEFAGKDFSSGLQVQVSAHGQGRRCNAVSASNATIGVSCFNTAGGKLNNNYGIVVIQ